MTSLRMTQFYTSFCEIDCWFVRTTNFCFEWICYSLFFIYIYILEIDVCLDCYLVLCRSLKMKLKNPKTKSVVWYILAHARNYWSLCYLILLFCSYSSNNTLKGANFRHWRRGSFSVDSRSKLIIFPFVFIILLTCY